MNAAILHSPKANSTDYSEVTTKKPILVNSIESPTKNAEYHIAKNETQTYSFVGIAG
jgi:hypothetical protein